MVLSDDNLKAKIIDRLQAQSEKPDEIRAAKARIEREIELLAAAESKGNRHDIYHHLVNIGTCSAVAGNADDVAKYFKRAVDEFPDKRYPLFILVMTLTHLGRIDEALEYTRRFEERFPKK
jgi:Tfp pilus assembly protein PilF